MISTWFAGTLLASVLLAGPGSLGAPPSPLPWADTDEEGLAVRVRTRLVEDRHHLSRGALASVHIDARNGYVLLRGSVPTFFDKTLIDTLTRSVDGVRAVDNQLLVPGEEPPYSAGAH